MRLITQIGCLLVLAALLTHAEQKRSIGGDENNNNLPYNYACSTNNLCMCNNLSLVVDCINNPASNPSGQFVDLSFAVLRTRVYLLSLNAFPTVPARAFANAEFVASIDNKISILILSARIIEANAFQTMGNLDAMPISAGDWLNVEMFSLSAPVIANYAFDNVRFKRLTFQSIETSDSQGYFFNMDSLAGAVSIDTLEFIGCDQVRGFRSSLTTVANRALIRTMIFDQLDMTSLSNTTWSSQAIQFDKVETLVWTSPKLAVIESNTFAPMSSLKYLALNGGQLTQLNTNTFSRTPLAEIDLSDNPIASINPFAFDGLGASLTRLSLDNIRIVVLYENVFASLASLHTLSMARQTTLTKFNWLAVLDLAALRALDLSFMSAGKLGFIDYTPSLSARIKTFVNSQLKLFTLRGYQLDDEDTCRLLPSPDQFNSASFPLIELDPSHTCSCFVIVAFKFYRMQFEQAQFGDFAAGVDKAPACYRTLYNTANYLYLTVPPNEVLDLERTCELQLEAVCRDVNSSPSPSSATDSSSLVSTSTPDDTSTRANGETESKWDESFYRTLLIVIGSVCIAVLVVAIVILIVAIVTVCRVQKPAESSGDKYELRNNNLNQQGNVNNGFITPTDRNYYPQSRYSPPPSTRSPPPPQRQQPTDYYNPRPDLSPTSRYSPPPPTRSPPPPQRQQPTNYYDQRPDLPPPPRQPTYQQNNNPNSGRIGGVDGGVRL